MKIDTFAKCKFKIVFLLTSLHKLLVAILINLAKQKNRKQIISDIANRIPHGLLTIGWLLLHLEQ